MHHIIFIMGVSGSGKTTTGKLLAERIHIPFFDADDYHSPVNIEKMKAGIPLTDADRKDWLQTMNQIAVRQQKEKGAVIACSALKQSYREGLQKNIAKPWWFFLEGSQELILGRMQKRKGHFMPAGLLLSQFATLEPPEFAFTISIDKDPASIVTTIIESMNSKSAIGIIGLGVMGKSLARNFASKDISLSLFNRFVEGTEENVAANFMSTHTELKRAMGFEDLSLFVHSLKQPAKIILMVNAGAATDEVLQSLQPLLSPGAIVIDGGNSHFRDTEKRMEQLKKTGIHLIGAGISGGEEGALKGPSIMPGGDKETYRQVQPFLEMIAAKDMNGNPSCKYIGPGGAGHFVKMVHNGIEYGEMQLLAEVYYLMRKGLQTDPAAIAEVFKQWNKGVLNSYLLEISIDILEKKEEGGWLLDTIADRATSKGTGSWASQSAAELGAPAGMMTTALFARYISADGEARIKMNQLMNPSINNTISVTTDDLKNAYSLARLINHHQGFRFIQKASDEYGWNINCSELAGSWTNGCIIRSVLMQELTVVLKDTHTILIHPAMVSQVISNRHNLATVVGQALTKGMAVPVLSESINYLHGISTIDSPMNIVQAQRDYFGAHTYQLKDDVSGISVHTEWKKKE